MAAPLDIHLIPVARYAGHSYPELLCVYAGEPSRRHARGREGDRLAFYLAMAGNAPLPPGKQDQALEELSRIYFETPGSVTAAMRRVAEELNTVLLERNLRLSGSGRQGLGILVQVAVRGEHLTVGISGPAHAYRLTVEGVQHINDPTQLDHGLGQSKTTPLDFFQSELHSGDTLLVAAQPSPDWSVDSLSGLHGQGPESLRRRLFGPAVTDVNAVLIQARVGKGVFHLPRPGVAALQTDLPQEVKSAAVKPPVRPQPPAAASRPAGAPPAIQPPTAAVQPAPAALEPSTVAEQAQTLPAPASAPAEQSINLADALAAAPHEQTAASEPASAALLHSEPAETLAAEPPAAASAPMRRERRPPAFFLALAAAAARAAGGLRAVWSAIRRGLVRILPEEALAGIPSSVMAFTALAAPVIIVVVASSVYLQLGRDAKRETLLSQAKQIGARAVTQTDIPTRHDDLTTALDLLRQVEVYGASPETQALGIELRGLLDELELVKRVDYKPAIFGGLLPDIRVTRIAVFENDLYLLDAVGGSVLHARLTGQGYELDNTFACGMQAGIAGVGPIVDIQIWPIGFEPRGNLLAMDAAGAVLFCRNDGPPEKMTLEALSSNEAPVELTGFALNFNEGIILNRASNNVWIYPLGMTDREPVQFFTEAAPDLSTVVDLAINREDLYLLHGDGKLTLCYYSNFQGVPTRCSQPAYIDRRPGRENMPLTPPSPFAGIKNTEPPDPSLFLLEPQTQAIYHFSLRNLAFQRQFMPNQTLAPGPATAFAVDNLRRYLYLAIANQVFYAVLP